MEVSVKQRLMDFVKNKGISVRAFEKASSLSDGYMKSLRHQPSSDKLSMILAAFPELNKSWLLTGEGEMLKHDSPPSSIENTIFSENNDKLSDYQTYLLPMKTHAGSLDGISTDSTLLQDCEKIISPIKGVDFAITVYGESMAPEYPSGSRVLIKRINPDIFIDWGRVYVLDTSNGVILKEILKCRQEGFVTCHSINPDPKYADFDVPLKEVYGMYRVLMCLSAK